MQRLSNISLLDSKGKAERGQGLYGRATCYRADQSCVGERVQERNNWRLEGKTKTWIERSYQRAWGRTAGKRQLGHHVEGSKERQKLNRNVWNRLILAGIQLVEENRLLIGYIRLSFSWL